MAAHFARSIQPRRTLSQREIRLLLEDTGRLPSVLDFRDHTIFALMLATGIRAMEAAALRWSDVLLKTGPRRVVTLRKVKGGRRGKKPAELEVRVPRSVGLKIVKLRSMMAKADYNVGPLDPVFQSTHRKAISTRSILSQFKVWQKRAGFEREFVLHELRHTAIMMAYRASGNDVEATRRFARHRDLATTQDYLHAADDTMDAISASIEDMLLV